MVSVGHLQDVEVVVEWANVSPGNPWFGLENETGGRGRLPFAVSLTERSHTVPAISSMDQSLTAAPPGNLLFRPQ